MKSASRNKPLYPGVKEAEEQRGLCIPPAEPPDLVGGKPNYDKFKGWTAEDVLSWLNID